MYSQTSLPSWKTPVKLVLQLALLAIGVFLPHFAMGVSPEPWSIGFHYGAKPPLDVLRSFDVVVVDPDHVIDPKPHLHLSAGKSELFAYVSIGEVQASRKYFMQMPPSMTTGENKVWSSKVIDQSHPAWPEFFVEKIVTPLWNNGYRGFFLDTMDSYQLIAKTDLQRQAQTKGLVAALKLLKTKFPQAKLIANRGFEFLETIHPLLMGMAAESLFSRYEYGNKTYSAVPENDFKWLKNQLDIARDKYKLTTISIDYVDPKNRQKTLDVARQIRALNFVPYVTDGALQTVGISNVAPIVRRVLLLHDQKVNNDAHSSSANRSMAMPLQYLGYRVELIDVTTEKLPEELLSDRYAAVVTWFDNYQVATQVNVTDFLLRAHNEGLKLLMANQLPITKQSALQEKLGFDLSDARPKAPLRVAFADQKMANFETTVSLSSTDLTPVRNRQVNKPVITLADANSQQYPVAAITPWGGYVAAPYALRISTSGDLSAERWIVDPIEIIRASFAAPINLPIADVTTENGRRLAFVHIDGDGFPSKAEITGTPFASEVMLNDFIRKYSMPHTVSVIQGEISNKGLYPQFSAALEKTAKAIYALPHVEAASHSLSHPFQWHEAIAGTNTKPVHLPLPNYKFNLNNEISGSANYINTVLLPPGKTTKVFLWTGDCVPPAEAIENVYASGMLNMNGGDTVIRKSIPTLMAVSAMSIRKNGALQVYTAQQNENVYTNNWTGPFYGFDKVLETFEMTDKPRRLKPVNLYYHTYIASKAASIASLHKAYQYIQSKAHYPIFGSDYIKKVIGFEEFAMAMDIAPEEGTQKIKLVTAGEMKTFRMAANAMDNLSPQTRQRLVAITDAASLAEPEKYFSLSSSTLWLESKPHSMNQSTNSSTNSPAIASANGRILDLTTSANHLDFKLNAEVNPEFDLQLDANCKVSANRQELKPLTNRSEDVSPKTTSRVYSYKPAATARVDLLVSVRC
jgi:polysaccharide biosynthesis protein PelA